MYLHESMHNANPIKAYILFHCRSFGILVWEVATYGKTPFNKIPAKDIVEMASNGSLKLTRYVIINC